MCVFFFYVIVIMSWQFILYRMSFPCFMFDIVPAFGGTGGFACPYTAGPVHGSGSHRWAACKGTARP